jgi:hypothetical protein
LKEPIKTLPKRKTSNFAKTSNSITHNNSSKAIMGKINNKRKTTTIDSMG